MRTSTFWPIIRNMKSPFALNNRRRVIHIVAILFLVALIWIEMGHVNANSFDHTHPGVDYSCSRAYFSPDGNPFPLCPGPYPGGGNCVWWAWEQWHLLGYNLPLNWGNAADWVVDAERFGLPLGLPPGSFDQEFSADFTGNGLTDLLLYNRQQGRVDVLTLQDKLLPNYAHLAHNRVPNETEAAAIPQRVSLSDAKTPANGWGS